MSTDAATADAAAAGAATTDGATAGAATADGATAGAATAGATVHLPASLVTLFPGAPRRLAVEAATVGALVDALNARWPGMRDRLCGPGPRLRPHINVFVDGERSTLATALGRDSIVHVIPAVSGG